MALHRRNAGKGGVDLALLTFQEFQALNKRRCEEAFHRVGDDIWPIQNWMLAIAGETGEACNLMKKVLRGDFTIDAARPELLKECADIICYTDLAITHLQADTGETVMAKFNEVSRRVGWAR